MDFNLHPSLTTKTIIFNLPLCQVLLQDESFYPWIILVPKRIDVSRMMDLSPEDQIQLMQEMDMAQKILWELFHPKQINVAAIGNKTPQLHIHVIARQASDPAWPNTVWDHSSTMPYTVSKKEETIQLLKNTFQKVCKFNI